MLSNIKHIYIYCWVVDLALKPWKPRFRSIGTICGFVSENVWGTNLQPCIEICKAEVQCMTTRSITLLEKVLKITFTFHCRERGASTMYIFFVNGARTQDIPLDTNHNHSLKAHRYVDLWVSQQPCRLLAYWTKKESWYWHLATWGKQQPQRLHKHYHTHVFFRTWLATWRVKQFKTNWSEQKSSMWPPAVSSQEICTWWRSSWPKQSSGNLFVFIISLQTKMEWTQFQI